MEPALEPTLKVRQKLQLPVAEPAGVDGEATPRDLDAVDSKNRSRRAGPCRNLTAGGGAGLQAPAPIRIKNLGVQSVEAGEISTEGRELVRLQVEDEAAGVAHETGYVDLHPSVGEHRESRPRIVGSDELLSPADDGRRG